MLRAATELIHYLLSNAYNCAVVKSQSKSRGCAEYDEQVYSDDANLEKKMSM